MPTSALANRRILATTHTSLTHKFQIGGFEGYLTIGLFDDGTLAKSFIKMAKEGSTLSGLVQGFCRAFSFACSTACPSKKPSNVSRECASNRWV